MIYKCASYEYKCASYEVVRLRSVPRKWKQRGKSK